MQRTGANCMPVMLFFSDQPISKRPCNAQSFILEARLNLLALEYGYRYRLDIHVKSGSERVEFVRTLREARYVGIPVRRTGGSVSFSKIIDDGSLRRHSW